MCSEYAHFIRLNLSPAPFSYLIQIIKCLFGDYSRLRYLGRVEQKHFAATNFHYPHPQSGVHVPSFSDARIDALLTQSRDAETMQALGRLRLVHAKYPKRVFLLRKRPVEVPVDRLVPFTDLMPDRLELDLIRRGNVPLTPLGLLKMRPNLASNNEQAKKLLQRSCVADPSRLMALPELVRAGLFVG